jgi:hypothetical protein
MEPSLRSLEPPAEEEVLEETVMEEIEKEKEEVRRRAEAKK